MDTVHLTKWKRLAVKSPFGLFKKQMMMYEMMGAIGMGTERLVNCEQIVPLRLPNVLCKDQAIFFIAMYRAIPWRVMLD